MNKTAKRRNKALINETTPRGRTSDPANRLLQGCLHI